MYQSPSWEANSYSDVQILSDFYGIPKFIAVFTRPRHWILTWSSLIQSINSHTSFFKIHFNIILYAKVS
jgi:hypothetical protein